MFNAVVKAQQNLIDPPYNDYSGPYVIKVQIVFLERPNNQWTANFTAAQLDTRAQRTLDKLNSVYNSYKIYFVWDNSLDCNIPKTKKHLAQAADDINTFPVSTTAIDIFDEENTQTGGGIERGVPSNAFHTYGHDSNGVPGAHMNVVIHEMGHVLGLYHPFNEMPCDENGPNPPANCANSLPRICNCCGDYVCDTPPTDLVNYQCKSNTHVLENNYMSYPSDDNCRTLFTPEQTRRIWAHLSLQQNISVLQDVQVIKKVTTIETIATSPSTPFGNIIIENGGELNINVDIKMLHGAVIRVQAGGKLNVNAKITAACVGKMWQGIVIEGDPLYSQDNTGTIKPQGEVYIGRAGIIEYAKLGAAVYDDSNSDPRVAPQGGGILTTLGAKFIDNTLSISFGAYNYNNTGNQSKIYATTFNTTDKYKDYSNEVPTYIKLRNVIRQRIRLGCKFLDERSNANVANLGQRPKGIVSEGASFVVQGCTFDKLGTAIEADKLSQNIGGFVVSDNVFRKCETGLLSNMFDNFSLYNNKFELDDNLPNLNTPFYTGAKLNNATLGFLLAKNEFKNISFNSSGVFIGTDVYRLGNNANVINMNKYKGLNIGNRARDINGDDKIGLLYTCNTHEEGINTDYELTAGSSIRKIQANAGNKPVANYFTTGNIPTITNSGNEIEYYYHLNNNIEDPGILNNPNTTGNTYIGNVTKKGVLQQTFCEVKDPCNPCDIFSQQSARFYNSKLGKDSLNISYNNSTDSLEKYNLAQAIYWKRFDMDEAANFVIQSYAQDTVQIQVDSILAWYKRIATFEADLLLAKHYFFEKDFNQFDIIWNLIPTKYQPKGLDSLDYFETTGLYTLLRPYLNNGYSIEKLPSDLLSTLESWGTKCNYAGVVTRIILKWNNIYVEEECDPIFQKNATMKGGIIPYKNNVQIYPNPTSHQVFIKFEENPNGYTLSLKDINGKSIATHLIMPKDLEGNFSTENIPNGIYFLEAQPNFGKSTLHKLIIIH